MNEDDQVNCRDTESIRPQSPRRENAEQTRWLSTNADAAASKL
jgi:hypothetical protein